MAYIIIYFLYIVIDNAKYSDLIKMLFYRRYDGHSCQIVKCNIPEIFNVYSRITVEIRTYIRTQH